MVDEPEIILLPKGISIGIGCYCPLDNSIMIESWLLEYPEHYRRVLDHEMNHYRICRSGKGFIRRTWENIVLEYRDIPDKAHLVALPRNREKIDVSNIFMCFLISVARVPGDVLTLFLGVGLWVMKRLTRNG